MESYIPYAEIPYAEFGMDPLRVTQKPYSSHSHANREAVDLGGANNAAAGSVDKWYARGCSWKVMYVQSGGDHFVYFETTTPVLWASGIVEYATLALCHQNTITHKVGQIYNPGDLMYTEGTYSGGRTGKVQAHIHCQVGRGKYAGTLLPKPYKMRNEARVQDLFMVPDNVTISVSGGLAWKRTSAVLAAYNGSNNTGGGTSQNSGTVEVGLYRPTTDVAARTSLLFAGNGMALKNGQRVMLQRIILRRATADTISSVVDDIFSKDYQQGDIIFTHADTSKQSSLVPLGLYRVDNSVTARTSLLLNNYGMGLQDGKRVMYGRIIARDVDKQTISAAVDSIFAEDYKDGDAIFLQL